MRFAIHDAVRPEASDALARKDHVGRPLHDLLTGAGAPPDAGRDSVVLFSWLDRLQWNLLTTSTTLIRDVYEKKIAFRGTLVLLLDDPQAPPDHARALERLFQRYRRLSPGRLYTVTPNRVKIRQLPGAGQPNP